MAWLAGWTNRLEIEIDYTNKIGGSVTHFPVTLFLESGNAADIFTEIGANKQKIAITKADGETELYAEIEVWDTGTPLGVIHTSKSDWVINADTSIFLYYDSAHADNTTYIGIVTGASPATNVWDSAAKMVHHLADATVSTVTDSTSNGNNGTKLANNEPIEATGQIGKGQDFDGTDDIINVGQAGTLDIANVFSISAWVRMDAEDTLSGVLSRGYWYQGWDFRFRDNGYGADPDKGQIQFCGGPDNIIDNIVPFDCENKLGWNHIAVTYDKIAEEMKFYLNGGWLQTFAEANAIEDRACDALIGATYSLAPAAYQFFDGDIDELRFSLTTRSAAWLKGEFNSGNDSLLSYCFLLEGSSAGQSSLTGNIETTDIEDLSGSVGATSGLAALLNETGKLVGLIESQSSVAGNVFLAHVELLAGSLAAQSSLTGNIVLVYGIIPPEMHEALIDSYSGGAWLWLAEITIPGYDKICIARNTEDIVYGGVTYSAANFEAGPTPHTADGSLSRTLLKVAQDAGYTLEDKLNATQGGYGGSVKIIRTHEDFLDYIVEPLEQIVDILTSESDTKQVVITCGIPNPLLRKIPAKRYSSKICPYALPGLFKGPECGYEGADLVCLGRFEDCDDKVNAVRWGGELGLDPVTSKI